MSNPKPIANPDPNPNSLTSFPLCYSDYSQFLSPSQKQLSVSVLEMKRSNIITIALSSLPPPRLLPPLIYRMDSSVLDRDDLQV